MIDKAKTKYRQEHKALSQMPGKGGHPVLETVQYCRKKLDSDFRNCSKTPGK
jgi:hypothetical protein